MADYLLSSFENLRAITSPYTILRFTMLIGGYIMLRPLIELFFRLLLKQEDVQSSSWEAKLQAQFSDGPNSTDFQSRQSSAHSSNQSSNGFLTDGGVLSRSINKDEIGTGWAWGDSARQRQQGQRQKFMEAWEAEQARRAEDEDLADIADLLED